MERVCPFLALGEDHRTAVAGYDADHVCRALEPAASLDRSRQLQLCLTEEHRTCERFGAIEKERRVSAATQWPPAPDAVIGSTRLVIEPDPSWREIGAGAVARRGGRRLAVGGAAAVIGVVAVASGATGGIGRWLGSDGPSAEPSQASVPASPRSPVAPSFQGEPPSLAPTSAPTQAATPAPTAAPTAVPPTAAPTPQTYVVQAGDTLGAIATRFGTTVAAIQAANGLPNTVINIGQVLVIP
jgi:LysM repeat protein